MPPPGGEDAAGEIEEAPAKKKDNMQEFTAIIKAGQLLRRVKRGRLSKPQHVQVENCERLMYSSQFLIPWASSRPKTIPLSDLVEVRSGYCTDNLHVGSKKYKFQCEAPENKCFSIIYNHRKYIHKSIDFTAPDQETRDKWVRALSHVIGEERQKRAHFNESKWFIEQFKVADKNKNGEVTFDEVWKLLNKLNLQMSDRYARKIFDEEQKDGFLNEERFVHFCERLTERPELRFILRHFSDQNCESLSVKELHSFLTEEQGFKDIDMAEAGRILNKYEGTQQGKEQEKVMGVMGLRKLLTSDEYGSVMKKEHQHVFQDMKLSLPCYFVSSSHNTYLTGYQVTGSATVEGYVASIERGARLLELDLFDGEHGEPVITHKRTLIQPITLRDTLLAIRRCAFKNSEYPVILTLENHVGLPQQKVMAELFQEVLKENLYMPPKDASRRPLPSPFDLRFKILLRGKKLSDNEGDDFEEEEEEKEGDSPSSPTKTATLAVHPMLSALIALPSVKLSSNIYDDAKRHPMDGSVSLSETKVETLYAAGAPLPIYTAQRFVKSYPKGIRQDSSNMNPIASWLSGVQAVALNFQTASEEFDLNQGLFSINGRTGYVLKPTPLLRGHDVRNMKTPQFEFGVGIISAQYLPKSGPSRDIIDPYVTVEIFGAPLDEWKVKTKIIKDNGFNPVWNENFKTHVCCPEVALVRFCVKDFESTSANDFVGEYTIPFNSIRPGYSQIRLHTGYQHTLDLSASLFVRIAIDPIPEEYKRASKSGSMHEKRYGNQ